MMDLKQGAEMWYRPENEASVFTPAVLVFPDRIEENIRRMIDLAGDVQRLRPHVKTHKIAEVISLQVQMGITRFKCATLSEVEMVAANGGLDVLLAYPLLGPAIQNFLQLMEHYPETKFSVTVDSMAACRQLLNQARIMKKVVNLYVDLDNGMHRTGIEPEKAVELIEFILEDPSLRFAGLHIYDGHIHDVDFEERKAHAMPILHLSQAWSVNWREKGSRWENWPAGEHPPSLSMSCTNPGLCVPAPRCFGMRAMGRPSPISIFCQPQWLQEG